MNELIDDSLEDSQLLMLQCFLGMSIGTSNKRNNNTIEISSDHTKYKTLNAEDTTTDTPTPLPTVIDTYDQTTISAITSNNYNYKKSR